MRVIAQPSAETTLSPNSKIKPINRLICDYFSLRIIILLLTTTRKVNTNSQTQKGCISTYFHDKGDCREKRKRI